MMRSVTGTLKNLGAALQADGEMSSRTCGHKHQKEKRSIVESRGGVRLSSTF